jgi:hypothetical protein
MLTVRKPDQTDPASWIVIAPESAASNLHEGNQYELSVPHSNCRVFIDDVELLMASGWFRWQPGFYAGRVTVVVIDVLGQQANYFIEVAPSDRKSASGEFDEMVQTIREFDQTLLMGPSAATMVFGNEGKTGLKKHLVLMARLRLHASSFLNSVSRIAQLPHKRLAADRQQLPLSRVRRIHPSALRDRTLNNLIANPLTVSDQLESLQIPSWTSTPTVDTPANRALLALLKRFRATVVELRQIVAVFKLPEDKDEQKQKAPRRLEELDLLVEKTTRLIQRPPFNQVKSGEIGSSGLTQIAAQPEYSRAYRLGCAAMASQVDGNQLIDPLRVNFSWGIYETWCFLQTLKCLEQVLNTVLVATTPKTASADLAFYAQLALDHSVELLFQATFAANKPASRSVWSISRERRPDILIVERKGLRVRSMVLDAKWRSGRGNVLEAMESTHIYHDSLRVESVAPSPCLLLLPGVSDVDALSDPAFIDEHGVGAIFEFSPLGTGAALLNERLAAWISS